MLFYHALHTCGEKKKVRQRDDMMVVLGLSSASLVEFMINARQRALIDLTERF